MNSIAIFINLQIFLRNKIKATSILKLAELKQLQKMSKASNNNCSKNAPKICQRIYQINRQNKCLIHKVKLDLP